MNLRRWQQFRCLLGVFACGSTVFAQTVVSTRTEVREMTVHAMGAGATADEVRDVPTATMPINGNVQPMPRPAGVIVPGTTSTTVEMEITELAFQIPDFDPADQLVYQYHVGTFSGTGNGNGTAYPDESGYVLYEMSRMPGESPKQAYLYGVHVDTGEVQVFVDLGDVSVNKSVEVLNNLSRAGMGFDRAARREMASRHIRYFPYPQIGEQRSTALYGNYLSVDELRQQIEDQSRCHIGQDELGIYYLDYCD